MKNKTNTALTLALTLASTLLVGCGSPARYTEVGGNESIVSFTVNVQDLMGASSQLLGELISSDVLGKAQNKPARVIIESLTNDTSTNFPPDLILNSMMSELISSGKATVEAGYVVGGTSESGVATDRLNRRRALEGLSEEDIFKPDFILQSSVTYLRADAERTKQYNYFFNMKLIDANTGLVAWLKSDMVQKLGTKPGVGF